MVALVVKLGKRLTGSCQELFFFFQQKTGTQKKVTEFLFEPEPRTARKGVSSKIEMPSSVHKPKIQWVEKSKFQHSFHGHCITPG